MEKLNSWKSDNDKALDGLYDWLVMLFGISISAFIRVMIEI